MISERRLKVMRAHALKALDKVDENPSLRYLAKAVLLLTQEIMDDILRKRGG